MQFICYFCPAIVSVILFKTKPEAKEIIHDIRMYILSLAVVNAITNILYYVFISNKGSSWVDTASDGLRGVAYIGMAIIVAIIWGLFAEYMMQRFTVEIEPVDRKKVTKHEKKEKNNK